MLSSVLLLSLCSLCGACSPGLAGQAVSDPAVETIRTAFPPPAGAQRLDPDAFGDWLQQRQLAAADVPVRTYKGNVVEGDFRVVQLPLVPGDLQQCADSAIRLRAEWLRETGGTVSFHATSGDPMPWQRYQGGERAYDAGNRLLWRSASAATWDQYLAAVFTWAGTMSLSYDTVAAQDPRAGDLLVLPGAPGHAVLLLDVAERGAESFILVGQGYMPAQDFHLVIGPEQGWWRWDDGAEVDPWDFPAESLRRWR